MRGEGVEQERKSTSCCCVGPSEPAAVRLNTTWSDTGENTMFLSDCFKNRCLAMSRKTFIWLVIDSWRATVLLFPVVLSSL
ncbi:hypothetical protein MtrunA17_Chr2g0302591 [Medicago truncatula]|nr:hypothetical protein MtrunA17_Chr2g0302591 [Medicago truncatula]